MTIIDATADPTPTLSKDNVLNSILAIKRIALHLEGELSAFGADNQLMDQLIELSGKENMAYFGEVLFTLDNPQFVETLDKLLVLLKKTQPERHQKNTALRASFSTEAFGQLFGKNMP